MKPKKSSCLPSGEISQNILARLHCLLYSLIFRKLSKHFILNFVLNIFKCQANIILLRPGCLLSDYWGWIQSFPAKFLMFYKVDYQSDNFRGGLYMCSALVIIFTAPFGCRSNALVKSKTPTQCSVILPTNTDFALLNSKAMSALMASCLDGERK